MGSERGELASTQDQSNFEDRVSDRRTDYAEPSIVRPFVDQLISLGVLPEPEEYHVRWPEVKNLNDAQRMALAGAAATVNKTQGEIVITTSEIRDKILGYEPFTEEQQAENDAKLKAEQDLAKAKATAQAAVVGGKPPFGDKPSGNGKDGTDGKNGKKGGKALDVAAMEAALIDDDIDLAAAIVAKALAEVGNGNGSPV
jgi:hypothetical protein